MCIYIVLAAPAYAIAGAPLLPPLLRVPDPSSHIVLHHWLRIVEPVLDLLGATYLWLMRPFAWIFIAIDTAVIRFSGLYLGYIDPDDHMMALRAAHHAPKSICSRSLRELL